MKFYLKKKCIIILIILTTIFSSCNKTNRKLITAKKGSLDLRRWDFDKDGNVLLKGEWEFYWNQFLLSKDIEEKNKLQKKYYINLPGQWKGYIYNKKKLPRTGFATFRLEVYIPNGYKNKLAFKIPENTNPVKVFVEDKLLTQVGTPGITKDEASYNSFPHVVTFKVDREIVNIVIHTSNFHHRKLAGLNILKIGSWDNIRDEREKVLILDFLLIGSIIIIGLYFIILFFISDKRIKDRSLIFFGLFCVFISIRSLFMHESYFNYIFPGVAWDFKNKLTYLFLFLAVQSYTAYIYRIFNKEFNKIVFYCAEGIYFILILIILFTKNDFFVLTINIHHLVIFIVYPYSLLVAIKVNSRRKNDLLYMLIGHAMFFIFVVHDIIVYSMLPHFKYKILYGLFIFIIFQMLFLSKRSSNLNMAVVELQNKTLLNKIKYNITQEKIDAYCKKYELTKREKDILESIIEGMTNKEIANRLFISYYTVRRHLGSIYLKASLSDRELLCEQIERINKKA